MSFSDQSTREIVLLSVPMLSDPSCPLRTLNRGVAIPTDLTFFDATFRRQYIQFRNHPFTCLPANMAYHRILCIFFASVLRLENYTNKSDVQWSIIVIADNKIAGEIPFTIECFDECHDNIVFVLLSRVRRSSPPYPYPPFCGLPSSSAPPTLPPCVPLAVEANLNQQRLPLPKVSSSDLTLSYEPTSTSVTESLDCTTATEDDLEVDLFSPSTREMHLYRPTLTPLTADQVTNIPRDSPTSEAPIEILHSFEVRLQDEDNQDLSQTTFFIPRSAQSYSALVDQVSQPRAYRKVCAKRDVEIVCLEMHMPNGSQVAFEDEHGFRAVMAIVKRHCKELDVVRLVAVLGVV